MVKSLKSYINVLLKDYEEQSLMFHLTLATSDYPSAEFVENEQLLDLLEIYINSLELDEIIRGGNYGTEH